MTSSTRSIWRAGGRFPPATCPASSKRSCRECWTKPITGVAVIRGAVVATVIPPLNANPPASGARPPADEDDRFAQAGLRGSGANCGGAARRHGLGAADRQKGKRRRDRRRRNGRQNQFSHGISPQVDSRSQEANRGPIQVRRSWFVPRAKSSSPADLRRAWLTFVRRGCVSS